MRIREKTQTDPDLPRKKTRAVERTRTIDIWCSLWRANRSSARVTKQYLPDFRRWLNRPKTIETTFHLTQFLTGHGCFGAYLCKIGRLPSATCPYCGDPEDSSLHTFFNCHIWEENRAPIVELLGQPLAPEMVQTILCGPPNIPSSPHFNINWPPVVGTPALCAKFLSMIEGILITKEADEREVQACPRPAARDPRGLCSVACHGHSDSPPFHDDHGCTIIMYILYTLSSLNIL